MAEGVSERVDAGEGHVAEPPVGAGGRDLTTAREGRRENRMSRVRRFRWAIVGLIALGVCSIAGAVALSSSSRRVTASSASGWAAWRPPDSGLAGAQEIADFIAPLYRATPADQLS